MDLKIHNIHCTLIEFVYSLNSDVKILNSTISNIIVFSVFLRNVHMRFHNTLNKSVLEKLTYEILFCNVICDFTACVCDNIYG